MSEPQPFFAASKCCCARTSLNHS